MVQVLLLCLVHQESHDHLGRVSLEVVQIFRLVHVDAPGHVVVEVFAHLADFVLENGVPVILNGVVRSAKQDARNFSPAVGRAPLQKEQNPALMEAPCRLLEHRVELVVPSFATLLA